MEKSLRLDMADITSKFDMTPEGYLQGTAIVTNIGVFSYRTKDGKIRKEARKPEQVFHPDTLNSLLGKPITILHPNTQTKMVDSSNVTSVMVGSIGTTYKQDGIYLSVPLTIMDKDAVENVKSGKLRALSLGYVSEDVPNIKNDVFLGMEYDVEQTMIRINHCALVPAGRCGSEAVIRLDGAEAPIEIENEVKETQMADVAMKVIHLDGIDYQAEERVILALKSAEKDAAESKVKLDSLETDKVKIEAERDSFKAKFDSLEKEVIELKARDVVPRSDVGKLVQARIDLEKTASQFKVEVKADMSDLDIKKAVILATDAEAKLDNDLYTQARFDCVVADAKKSVKSDEDIRSLSADLPSDSEGDKPISLSESRDKFNAILTGAHKKAKE